MYYDNKRVFYVKQYGPTLIISVIAIALIATGSVMFLRNNSINNNNIANSEPIVDVQSPNEETSALQTVEPVIYFANLEKLVLSDEVNVASVDNNGNISFEYKGDKFIASMIGISYNYATEQTYNKIRTDLEGKTVKIAFDTQREQNGISTVYVYMDGELYNANLLRSGLATLKSERVNVALATDLSNAQAYARDNKLGVWNR